MWVGCVWASRHGRQHMRHNKNTQKPRAGSRGDKGTEGQEDRGDRQTGWRGKVGASCTCGAKTARCFATASHTHTHTHTHLDIHLDALRGDLFILSASALLPCSYLDTLDPQKYFLLVLAAPLSLVVFLKTCLVASECLIPGTSHLRLASSRCMFPPAYPSNHVFLPWCLQVPSSLVSNYFSSFPFLRPPCPHQVRPYAGKTCKL